MLILRANAKSTTLYIQMAVLDHVTALYSIQIEKSNRCAIETPPPESEKVSKQYLILTV